RRRCGLCVASGERCAHGALGDCHLPGLALHLELRPAAPDASGGAPVPASTGRRLPAGRARHLSRAVARSSFLHASQCGRAAAIAADHCDLWLVCLVAAGRTKTPANKLIGRKVMIDEVIAVSPDWAKRA